MKDFDMIARIARRDFDAAKASHRKWFAVGLIIKLFFLVCVVVGGLLIASSFDARCIGRSVQSTIDKFEQGRKD